MERSTRSRLPRLPDAAAPTAAVEGSAVGVAPAEVSAPAPRGRRVGAAPAPPPLQDPPALTPAGGTVHLAGGEPLEVLAPQASPPHPLAPMTAASDVGTTVSPESVSNVSDTPGPAHWSDWHLNLPPLTGHARLACPACARTQTVVVPTVLADTTTGLFYCARCGHHGDAKTLPSHYHGGAEVAALFHVPRLPSDVTRGWDLADTLTHLGLDAESVMAVAPELALGSGYFDQDAIPGWKPCLLIPVRAIAEGPIVDVVQIRTDGEGGPSAAHQRAKGGLTVPLGWERITETHLVVVDHPLDALALLAAGQSDTVALPEVMNPIRAGGGNWATLALPVVESRINLLDSIVFALRDNEESHRFEEELGRRLGLDRCKRTRWQAHRPPTGVAGAARVVAHAGAHNALISIAEASAFPIAGVHELMDVEDRLELLYEFGLLPGAVTGWPTLDTHYTVKPGQWTAVTGIPGHGKSTFLDDLLVHLAQLHGWRFGVFSPENQPVERHFASLMEKYVGRPFNQGPTLRIGSEEKDNAKIFLQDHFKIILPDEDQGNWSLEGILELARILVYRHGIRGLVIDPWNEIDHSRPGNLTETEHISQCLTRIRRFARVYGVHVWVVAHPTKLEPRSDGKYPVPTPYMISGGAHWRNKADNSITVYRDVGEKDEDIVDIHIQKIRFKEVGRVGLVSLRHNATTGRYHDDLDQLKRVQSMKNGGGQLSETMRVPERRYAEPEMGGLDYFTDDEDPMGGNWRDG